MHACSWPPAWRAWGEGERELGLRSAAQRSWWQVNGLPALRHAVHAICGRSAELPGLCLPGISASAGKDGLCSFARVGQLASCGSESQRAEDTQESFERDGTRRRECLRRQCGAVDHLLLLQGATSKCRNLVQAVPVWEMLVGSQVPKGSWRAAPTPSPRVRSAWASAPPGFPRLGPGDHEDQRRGVDHDVQGLPCGLRL